MSLQVQLLYWLTAIAAVPSFGAVDLPAEQRTAAVAAFAVTGVLLVVGLVLNGTRRPVS